MLRKDAGGVSSAVIFSGIIICWLGLVTGGWAGNGPPASNDTQPSSISAASPAANQLFSDAGRLLNQEKYHAAADKFWSFLERYPNDPLSDYARHYIGVCALRRGELSEAASLFAQVVSATKRNEVKQQSLIYFGWCLLSSGSAEKPEPWEQAATIFQAHRDQFPNSRSLDESLFLQAESLSRLQRLDEAQTLYRQIIEQHPKSARRKDALLALALVERQLGRNSSANQRLDEVLETYPDDERVVSIHFDAAERAFEEGKFGLAEQLYRKVVDARPESDADVALVKLAACLAKQGQHAEAAELYARLPVDHPQSEHVNAAWMAAGHHYLEAGECARAKQCLNVIIERDLPGADRARHWLVRCQLDEGQSSSALDQVETALREDLPDAVRHSLLLDRADTLASLENRHSDAFVAYIQAFNEARLPSIAGRALQGMLDVAQSDGEFKSIVEMASMAMQTRPHGELVMAAHVALATARLNLGQYAETAKLYNQLLAQHPQHASAAEWAVNAAWAMLLGQQYEQTIQTLANRANEIESVTLRAEAELIRGFALLKLDRSADAITPLERVIMLDPDSSNAADATEALVRCYRLEERWNDASRLATELLEREPARTNSPDLQLDLAEIAFHRNDIDAAEAYYLRAIDETPHTETLVSGLQRLAWICIRRSQTDRAILFFDRLIDEQPHHELASRALLDRARCYQQIGRHQDAVTDLWTYLETKPNSSTLEATGVFALGISFIHLDQLEDALSSFRTVTEHYPQFARMDEALYQVGTLAHQLSQNASARIAFERITREFSTSAWAAPAEFHLGQLSSDEQRDEAAIRHFEAAIERGLEKPQLSQAYYRLGWARFRSGDFVAARDAFKNQQSLGMANSFAHDGLFMLAESLLGSENWQAAAKVYERVIDHPQTNRGMQVMALLHGGQAMLQSDRLDVAAEWLERLIDDPRAAEFRPKGEWQLGRCRRQQERLDEAARHLEWAATHGTGEVAAQATYDVGQLYVQQHYLDQAISRFAQLLKESADEPSERIQRLQAQAAQAAARCARTLATDAVSADEQSRLFRQAAEFWQIVIDRYPESPEAEEARQQVGVQLTGA